MINKKHTHTHRSWIKNTVFKHLWLNWQTTSVFQIVCGLALILTMLGLWKASM